MSGRNRFLPAETQQVWASSFATFVPNYVSFVTSIAELAHEEEIVYSVNHSLSLLDALGSALE